jgi:hypothetical protein
LRLADARLVRISAFQHAQRGMEIERAGRGFDFVQQV